MPPKNYALPYRRSSNASEDDFFDIPDEPCLSIAKRQLRRVRTWATVALIVLFILWQRRERPPPLPLPHIHYDEVDWSRFAYTQYATNEVYMCNCLMVFEALHRLGSRAERVLFYPEEWDLIVEDEFDRVSQLLLEAKLKYNVMLIPIKIEGVQDGSNSDSRASWDTSTAKLMAFGEHEYDRVIHLDSDVILLQTMDELFFLPPTTVAMPRAYWLLPDKLLSSLMVVIEPSLREYLALTDVTAPTQNGQVDINLTDHRYDMELLNRRYGDSAMVLPHRQYGLLSGEFRTKDHRKFLGNDDEVWDPDHVLAQAKFVHFSDWPLPKPWIMWSQDMLAAEQPKCDNNPGTPQESGCRDREIWKMIYDKYRRQRKDICKLLSYPAPV
ncbi:CAZyme family GT8 [Penicillium roqueforti]|uniref:Glucose N-acetyltransferase 1 n=1 Tax=Penicillium roqueforti (strain FM164) TaxID=1365484 RepID=W6QK74_PENRF|nr:CAZyme family GT8 [Penicillium roqueforti]CDM29982.1 Glucose N-acetyltransferase 1 [Penicillium roqueforti FM164]KAF9240117.1 CAZyme family GT8 [Penicillium roqueforti]KAI1831937.1 CAZyme family GT8 [Penicillium roqueforti]KAI2670624.1 CAZyme family GT8 [Penicillium roqueforti]KAI2677584.1 CAZyme family GT8 [Penicillium roqueforti]